MIKYNVFLYLKREFQKKTGWPPSSLRKFALAREMNLNSFELHTFTNNKNRYTQTHLHTQLIARLTTQQLFILTKKGFTLAKRYVE